MAGTRRRPLRVLGVVGVVGLLGAGYVVADAHDLVPGVLTTRPVVPDPLPHPSLDAVEPAERLLIADTPDAPLPEAAELQRLTEDLADDDGMGQTLGVVLTDTLTGEVLVDLDGDVPAIPASTVKVLGAIAALDALGPDHVLHTRAVLGDDGEVVLVGGGDILLTADEASDDVDGRASLADLAAQTAQSLREAGSDGASVVLDDTLFDGPDYAADWAGLDFWYVMRIGPIAIASGRDLDTGYVPDPGLSAATAFAELLESEGIEVSGDVQRRAAPQDAVVLGEVASAPIGEVVDHMLVRSENSVAEVLTHLVAVHDGRAGSFDGATRAVLNRLDALGIDTTGLELTDTSGLSMSNRVPPRVLVEALEVAGQHPHLASVLDGLPISGLEGTLSDRLDGDTAGLVRAKTGTLFTAVGLTGTIVDADGRVLTFALLTNEVTEGEFYATRAAVDEWVRAIAACGCRGE